MQHSRWLNKIDWHNELVFSAHILLEPNIITACFKCIITQQHHVDPYQKHLLENVWASWSILGDVWSTGQLEQKYRVSYLVN